ncbi:hypothetical protein [Burkholderia thailandensis]|uniref:hypothetical protein n=1 Tax=Burkholderia thailandensis TaxID=57975 RepID=UPI00298F95E4|nr:hypothetical protein [Burkholderia thailandensis]
MAEVCEFAVKHFRREAIHLVGLHWVDEVAEVPLFPALRIVALNLPFQLFQHTPFNPTLLSLRRPMLHMFCPLVAARRLSHALFSGLVSR